MFLLLGFIPCYLAAWGLKKAGLLRIPAAVELAGLDISILAEAELQTAELEQAEDEMRQQARSNE